MWRWFVAVGIVALLVGVWLGRCSCVVGKSPAGVTGLSDPVPLDVGSIAAARRRARAISG